MNKLTSLVFACALVAGCKDKQASKQGPAPGQGSAPASPQVAADPAWADKLPSVTAGDTQLLLQYASGLVRVRADGTILVANAPATAPADPRTPGTDPFASAKVVELGGLGEALGLPPITPRPESAYGVIDSAGSGSAAAAQNPADIAYAKLGHPVAALGAPAPPRRMTAAFGLAHPNDVSGGVIVFADPDAPSTTLVDVLAQTGGFLAVKNGDKLGALPVALDRHAPAPVAPTQPWFEVRLTSATETELVPSTPFLADRSKLGEAVAKAGGAVDVLVSQQTKVQELVSVLEQLRAANVEAIGLGAVPGSDGGVRGATGPRVLAWDFFVPEVEAKIAEQHRTALAPVFAPMRECYVTAQKGQKKPLSGTAQVDIFIAPTGKVQGAETKGLPAPLTKCVVDTLKSSTVTFPQPGKAGGRMSARIGFFPGPG